MGDGLGRGPLPAVALAIAFGVAAAGCGDSGSAAQTTAASVEELAAGFVPGELLGLTVGTEPLPEAVDSVEGSYLEAVRLFGLRDGETLVGTLQVGRFHSGTDYESSDFRRALLEQVGGTRPREVRIGDETVFLTTGVRQNVAVWFSGEHMMVLGTREEFPRPRGLLREAVQTVEPGGPS